MLLFESENVRYQMSVRSWQVRSRQTGCKAEASANVHPKKTAPKKKATWRPTEQEQFLREAA